MTVFKCKMCGGNLEVSEGSSVATCEYCGTKQTIPTSSDEEIVNLFNRANYLRLKCEFDKAADTYERILELDNTQAEAHWGIVLCKYGVEYVEDKKALFDDERKPTCHRTQMESILSDADYQATLDNADSAAAEIYKLQAREINDLQKKILDVVKNEAPYDVFICYKERDEKDQRTQDSVIANDIYHELTESGLKVFFAAITLEDKLGEEYEPYIYAALSSARVMIALGTKIEYFNAVWVKNEWSRYLHMMKMNKDKKRTLIPCYRDMDAYDLPAEFAHLQALNMADIAFLPDLIRNIKKLVGKDAKGSAMNSGAAVDPAAPLLKRAFLLLEDGEFDKADESLEKVLNLDPENARAYIGKLMVQKRIRQEPEIAVYKKWDSHNPEPWTEIGDYFVPSLESEQNFRNALKFADSEYKNVLSQYSKLYRESAIEYQYQSACYYEQQQKFDTAADIFYRIDCHDSKLHLEECKQKYILQLRDHVTQLKDGVVYTYEGKKKRAEIAHDNNRTRIMEEAESEKREAHTDAGEILIIGGGGVAVITVIVMLIAGFGFGVFFLNSLPWGLGIGIATVVICFMCHNASISKKVENECSGKLQSAQHEYELDCEKYDEECKSTLEQYDQNYRKTVQNFLSSFENACVPASPRDAGDEPKNAETFNQ